MTRRFLWILVLGAVVATVAVGAFALERTGSGESPTPPAHRPFSDNVVDKNDIDGLLKPDNHEANVPDVSNRISTGDENEPDENEGGRGPAANENEPDENDRGD
jgi:hypothetical protein